MIYYKYPRTPHLPWSPGKTNDDKSITEDQFYEFFTSEEIIVTEKFDGENTTIYHDGKNHARSIDSVYHKSRTVIKSMAPVIAASLPYGYRICGENMYATHSIEYIGLPSYFMAFSIIDGTNTVMDWDSTVSFCKSNGIEYVPVLYKGILNKIQMDRGWDCGSRYTDTQEGYVMRLARSFHIDDFGKSVAKYVRSNHVQTDDHWMRSKTKVNKLK